MGCCDSRPEYERLLDGSAGNAYVRDMKQWLVSHGFGEGTSAMELQSVGQLVLPLLMNELATGPNDLPLPKRNALLYLLCRVMQTEGGQAAFSSARIANLKVLLWHHNEELPQTQAILRQIGYKSMFFEKVRARVPMRFTVVVDKSGSMATSKHSRTRWEEANLALQHLTKTIIGTGDEEVTVILFSSNIQVYKVRSVEEMKSLFAKAHPGGSTDLAGAVRVMFSQWFSGDHAPLHALVITDGVPDSQEALTRELVQGINGLPNGDVLGISMLQVGCDHEAAEFLHELQDHLVEAGARWNVVDCLTHNDYNGGSFCDIMHQQLPGADSSDEE